MYTLTYAVEGIVPTVLGSWPTRELALARLAQLVANGVSPVKLTVQKVPNFLELIESPSV